MDNGSQTYPRKSWSSTGSVPSLPRLLVALLFLSAVSGCGKQQSSSPTQEERYAAAIKKVCEQDKVAGEKCKQDAKADKLAAVRTYVQALRAIDLRQCPPDFQEAFLKHRYACEEVIPFLEKYPPNWAGDMLRLFEFGSAIITQGSLTTEGEREFERIRKAITTTYFEVEKVALRYEVQANH